AVAAAGRAAAFDGEEALAGADLAHARAGGAGGGFHRTLGAGAVAGRTGGGARNGDGLFDPAPGFFQRDAQVVAQVLAAGGAAAAAGAGVGELAEQILEHIGEGGAEIAVAAAAAKAVEPGPAALERRMAEAVIGGLAL